MIMEFIDRPSGSKIAMSLMNLLPNLVLKIKFKFPTVIHRYDTREAIEERKSTSDQSDAVDGCK